jgi:hypothetical protein
MSEQRLKELLEDLAWDSPQPDGMRIDAAWQAAVRRRRWRSALVGAGAAAAVVLGAAVAIGVRSGDLDVSPGGKTSSPTPSQGPSTSAPIPPNAKYDGVPVWWAPPAAQESKLPWLETRLPRSIDLSSGQAQIAPGQSALGLSIVWNRETGNPVRFVVLTSDGKTSELEAGQIKPNRDRDGNAGALTPFNGGVSPDGWHVFFAQQSSIELYDFRSGTWRTIDTPDWLAEGARWLDTETIWVPNNLEGGPGTTYGVDGQVIDRDVTRVDPDIQIDPDDMPYGIWADAHDAVAGSYFLKGPVPGGPYVNPEAIVARIGDQRTVLAIPIEDRFKGCCPVAGWIGDDTVAFESGAVHSRVLAWRVATHDLYRVAEFTGLASGREVASQSWAWQALR